MALRTDVSTLTIISLSAKYSVRQIAEIMDCSMELVRQAITGRRSATPNDRLDIELIKGLGDRICTRCGFRVIAEEPDPRTRLKLLCTVCYKRGDPYVEHPIGRSI
jgi:hypothetical protein